MVLKYSKHHKIETWVAGDIVSIKLPVGTRTSTDHRRVFGRILEVPHDHVYRIQTQWGIIDRLMPSKELSTNPSSIADGLEIVGPSIKIPLSRVALEHSTSERVIISCNCTKGCKTNRCRCVKEGQKCSIHCHIDKDFDCGFLASLSLRTEKGLIEKRPKRKDPKKVPSKKGKEVVRVDEDESEGSVFGGIPTQRLSKRRRKNTMWDVDEV